MAIEQLKDMGEAAMLLEAGAKVIAKQQAEIEALEADRAELRKSVKKFSAENALSCADRDRLHAEITRLHALLRRIYNEWSFEDNLPIRFAPMGKNEIVDAIRTTVEANDDRHR